MALVSEYDVDFNAFVYLPEEDQGVDNSPLLLFSDEIEGFFLGGEATHGSDEIFFSEACFTLPSVLFNSEPYSRDSCLMPPLLFDSEPYPHDACLTPPSSFDSEPHPHDSWSPARSSLKDAFYPDDFTSPETVDPGVLTGPIPPTSLPSSSSTPSSCTAQDPALMSPSEGKPSPAPTCRHVRPRYSRQAKVAVKSYLEGSHTDGDEYEQKRGTPKRSRRSLAMQELVSDSSSASSTPLTTPTSSTFSPRPTRSLPHRIVKKQVPTVDQGLDSDTGADDSEFDVKKVYKARGSGNLKCFFAGCSARFQHDPERKRHCDWQHSKKKGSPCEYCGKLLSRTDAVLRHLTTCPKLHPGVAKRRGGTGKRKSAKKGVL
ncbi:hypothetical protein IW261DRAFT_1663718 [Armillaria novae-zelandiae]|uniref:C2H2-type domain-containing protein n=1 Tax=Armillaria novae-zelandiae TaxID=153914 RepID=A0AA39PLQ1_9AGAR|nr:hypothetical protein IW261DRAFT_1663718 [Armillaria novae-zelandiae]